MIGILLSCTPLRKLEYVGASKARQHATRTCARARARHMQSARRKTCGKTTTNVRVDAAVIHCLS